MIQGLYAAANGMIAVEDRQAVIANNIANVSTNGFKRQLTVQRGYYGEYLDSRSAAKLDLEVAPGGGLKTSETFTHHSAGSVTGTGNPLDVALLGPGFFKIRGAEGDLYTRNGQFTIDANGVMTAPNGYPVLDVNDNEIFIDGGNVAFDDAGNVYVNNELRGQVSITEFEDPHGLIRSGENFFVATEESLVGAAQAENTKVAGSSLEISNVDLPLEMVNLMMALRAYSANQKILSTIDETASRMIDQVGGQ